ncbi:MAG TPA: hypothetical protein V6D50_16265 [Chroococcales cyanobacterium]
MPTHQANQRMPLTDQDQNALDDIFAKVALEDMKQIEDTVALYSVAPLEPWEETGWVVNSSLPNLNEATT